MKKIIYSAMAVAMLATTSCKDDFAESFVGDQATVEFSISTPEIGTRAYSDGTTATKLQYAIYDAEGNILDDLTVTNGRIDGSATISLQLKNNKSYQMVVWAADPYAPYTVDFSDKTMQVDYTNATCNDESRDAFYAYKEFTVNGNKTERIELKRPFAQLNIGANDFDAAQNSGYAPTESKVTVDNVYSTFNFATGNVGAPQTVTFGYANLPQGEIFPVTGYRYLAMNYLLVGADQELHNVTFEHQNSKEGDSKTIGSVPLKRNYRTNIYGGLLTSTTDVNVQIVPGFDDEYNNPIAVSSVDELEEAIDNPTGVIVLQNDIDLGSEMLVINAPSTRSNTISNIVIDLNGKTVTSTAKKAFEVYTNATFKNGKIEAANRCIDTRTAVNLVLDNVTLIADKYTSSYGNPQPLTIGGEVDGTEVTMNNVNISAEAGYGIITFVKTNLTATNSTISGYSALYVKPGSDNSEFNFINTTLSGSTENNDVEGNSFSTIALRANDVTINVDGDSKVIATGNYCYALSFSGKTEVSEGVTGAYVTILGKIEGNILAGGNLNDNTIVVDKQYKEALEAKGYIVEIVNGNAVITNATIVSTADELVAALEDGQNVYLKNDIKIDPASMSNAYGTTGINVKNGQTIDGGGHTLNIKGAGGTWDSGINTTGGIIRNITVTGSFRGIFINHNSDHSEKVVLDNVTITGTVYTISCDQGLNQGIEATGCTFNGWTSFAKTAGEAKFVNCYFGEGNGYKYCRPYSNTEFVNCTFCPGYAVDETQATVTFTNCTWEK